MGQDQSRPGKQPADSVNDWGRVGEYIGKSIVASLRFDELLRDELGLDKSDPYYWEKIAAFCEIDLGLKPQEYWNDRDMSQLMALAERRLARDRLAGAQPAPETAPKIAAKVLKTRAKSGGRPGGTPVDANKLREYRGKMSQEQFAGECGVSVVDRKSVV